ncbi:tRNA (uracil-5-)-methyltransferase TRM9 [Kluyveromyces marxianus]|uniref:tRNA (Uracil-5-)-methyltransferase TRM9 n=2 Tax=Kluyveromyces marxianus TaxID=4911 RepID=W0TES9_KLUMD|nr:tRNA (uracil-5-)-methyltransferase TRM9 [Kluyveromyces marxianus DMKU3-1042]QGN16356.1 tRNA (uracil-5-)-methyltransferase TRM9 [Kluyveromyces marxianus]BAO40624.1 tRNA (uracil-5-)-methyltransferase TRM9 [Kluyveromyces marxianus DMKU3-1042]BAP72105.1 tRNA (uracil-5-)-methyltransferase TRM9 [Kluyveromyces marxianus]
MMAELKEEEYVHQVYNEIAPHFSQTRYKPWPIVTEFLNSREMGSIGIDVGCGNGKYLGVNPNLFIIGSDRSSGLISCAHDINKDYNVLIADGICLPHRDNTFDFAISIAVVHHWSTRERRVQAIRHIMSKLKSGGEMLIYCWALEQADSRRGYQEGMEQDVLVPWVLQKKESTKKKESKPEAPAKPDLTNIPKHERSAYIQKWKQEQEALRLQREREQEELRKKQQEEEKNNTKYRYYHLYRKGELEEDCEMAGGIIIGQGYEKDNWYVIAKKA